MSILYATVLRFTTVGHVLTTATIDRPRQRYPEQRFEVRRFRPDIVVEVASGIGVLSGTTGSVVRLPSSS